MRHYLIQRLDTGEFYRHRPYGNRWVKDREKAKLFKRQGDAGNAINLMRLKGIKSVLRVFVAEITVKFTEECFDYFHFPKGQSTKIQ